MNMINFLLQGGAVYFGNTSQNKKTNILSAHDVQETTFTDNEQGVSQMVGKVNKCKMM